MHAIDRVMRGISPAPMPGSRPKSRITKVWGK